MRMKDDNPLAFETLRLPANYDHIALDQSQIRELPRMKRGSMAHCNLSPQRTSIVIKHKTIEEIWYFLQGQGQVWRKQGAREEVVDISPGISLTLPPMLDVIK